MRTSFKEEQKFVQWWLWVLLVGFGLFPLYLFWNQIVLGNPVGSKPMSDLGVILVTILLYGIIVFFGIIKLRTEINAKEIKIHFFPLVKKTISWDSIASAEVINYGFVGGWGIRLFTKYGTAYNIKGNKGLAVQLKTGKKLLIGTQKEEELTELLNKINSSKD